MPWQEDFGSEEKWWEMARRDFGSKERNGGKSKLYVELPPMKRLHESEIWKIRAKKGSEQSSLN